MKATTAYDRFIRLEERSAVLYMELSVRFLENPGLSWFWIQMAMERKQRAGMLHHCLEAGVFARELPNGEQFQKLNRLLRQLEARLVQPGLTLDDAFVLSTELEASGLRDVYLKLSAPIHGPALLTQKKMKLSGAGHFERLYEAACAFNASASIQTRLIALLSRSGSEPETGV